MVSPRAPLSKLTAGLLFVSFLIYLVIINRLEVGQSGRVADPASFSSRMLMNLPSSGSGDGNNLHDTISNSGVITAIDNMVNQIGVAGSDLTETRVKDISNEIAKQIADYVVQRLGKAATISNPCSSCWKHGNATDLPVIYLVTPTYRRPEQIPDLTRLAQTLLNVPAVHWIVVEDNSALSPAIASLLKRYGIPHTHLKAQMPEKYKKSKLKPRGVANRNAALDWVRSNCKSGVVYFADDDNTYDIRLFEEMRFTKKVSMWPVGLVTKVGLSSPVVNDKGVVVDFFDGWMANRKFPVDMAGFAVSVQLILEKSDVYMPYVPGHEEDGFLKKLDVSPADIEPKANWCTQIFVWHTQTKSNTPANRTTATGKRYKGTNIDTLQEWIV